MHTTSAPDHQQSKVNTFSAANAGRHLQCSHIGVLPQLASHNSAAVSIKLLGVP